MGCLNSTGQFGHWFGNIHLSGPCNRACYFCIGQHMMALDKYNNLLRWPLEGIQEFVEKCNLRGVKEVNLTGTNTDPMMYSRHEELTAYLREHIDGVKLGVRTNGAAVLSNYAEFALYDKSSISLTSFDENIYRRTMGLGLPPNVRRILKLAKDIAMDVKINIVLCPETVYTGDLIKTLEHLDEMGVTRVNLREPYGQPHIGCPLGDPQGTVLGMPFFKFGNMQVTYWDVHYVEVESVNLYASGRVSLTYPITKGCTPDGKVDGQENFTDSGRVRQQWLGLKGS